MSDIYTTPKANVLDKEESRNIPHVFWRAFFWFHLVLIPLIVVLVVVLSESVGVLDYINLVIFPFIVLTLFGYGYSKKIGPNIFWRFLCFAYPIWFIYYEFIAPLVLGVPSYGEKVELDFWLALEPVFGVPACFAIYKYSFKSCHIWDSSVKGIENKA